MEKLESNSTKELLALVLNKFNSIQQDSKNYIKQILGHDLNQNLQLLKDQQELLERVESDLRRKNLVFYGIEDNNKETFQELKQKLLGVLNHVMHLQVFPYELDHFYRIGQWTQGKHRPVLLKLNCQWRKADILFEGRRLKGSGIFVTEDFTKEEEKERKRLIPIMKELRKQNKYAVLRRTKLIVDGVEWKEGKEVEVTPQSPEELHEEPKENEMCDLVYKEKEENQGKLKKEKKLSTTPHDENEVDKNDFKVKSVGKTRKTQRKSSKKRGRPVRK